MIPLAIAPDLMEEAVLLAERQARPALARAFRRKRDRVYETADPELRETQFQKLALDWFGRFGLRTALEAIVNQHPALGGSVAGGRIVRAMARSAEGADLVDPAPREDPGSRPLLVVRLRPESLLTPATLETFLRHELMHITDILDPAFGYERSLPPSDDGPSADNLLRDRYRVVWDVTIDGRLASRLGQTSVRDARWREFRTTFAMLGEGCPDAFDTWWNESHPTHRQIVDFALAPAGSAIGRSAGRCPFCQFPVASLDSRVSALADNVAAALRAEHPSWHVEQGICSQCLDLYEARYGYASTVR